MCEYRYRSLRHYVNLPHLVIPDLDGFRLRLDICLIDDVESFDESEDGSFGLPVDLDGGGAESRPRGSLDASRP